jgi:hypothetical protein
LTYDRGRTTVRPRDAVGKARRRVAAELIGDLERVYRRSKEADKELKELVASTGTTLMDLHGIGPSGAARLLVEVGDITRFPNRAHQLALAIAAAKRPELLIFDEPAAALDPLARKGFMHGLVEFVNELGASAVLSLRGRIEGEHSVPCRFRLRYLEPYAEAARTCYMGRPRSSTPRTSCPPRPPFRSHRPSRVEAPPATPHS